MKNIIATFVLIICLGTSWQSFAQDVNTQLKDECEGDVDLSEYIIQVVATNDAVHSGYLDESEKSQIAVILNDEAIVDLSTREKVAEVLAACSEGRILQERNARIINQ